ncbi:hypothetical protein [Paracnuella aquatica]|uniref:hypothetical protein n=1 Tax=Paracnuella aquatica TaxID=2268757 RepID=UPI000F50B0E5|nr:hypothetical protein [Paracnuella aquatica]RPD51306.1 hypothetical protein DRJ53_01085 [Paracnuella aquatica]
MKTKKILMAGAVLLALGITAPAVAQEETAKEVKQAGKKAGKAVKKGAQKAGAKTAEVASKGKSKITDAEHKDKVGPNGEVIYIDNHARTYWVDKNGRRHYVVAAELKDKVTPEQ